MRALTSLDEGRIGEAYLPGDLDIDGDMLAPLALRGSLKDFHPVHAIWRFLQPLLMGQIHANKQAIAAHYEMDPDFFLSLLNPKTPCYKQGVTGTLRGPSCYRMIIHSPGAPPSSGEHLEASVRTPRKHASDINDSG